MAFKVVRFVAEHAVLFRKRLQLTPLRTVPVGGMCLWQGAVTETISVSEGMLREAGKILNTWGAPISLTDSRKAIRLSEQTHSSVLLAVFPLMVATRFLLKQRSLCCGRTTKLRLSDTVAVFISVYHTNNVPEMFTWRSLLRNGVILTDWLSRFYTKIASQPQRQLIKCTKSQKIRGGFNRINAFLCANFATTGTTLPLPTPVPVTITVVVAVFLYKRFRNCGSRESKLKQQHPNFAGCHLVEESCPLPCRFDVLI